MKKLLVLICLTMMFSLSSAQDSSPITVTDGKYYQNNIGLSYKGILLIVADVPDAYREVKKGRGRYTTGMIFSGLGGAMLGGSLADVILGTTYMPEPASTGIILGAVFIGTGVWLSFSGGKKISTGVEIYNCSFDIGYKLPDVRLNFGATKHGIGFTCTF